LENQLKNFWKLKNRMLIKYHIVDSAEMRAYFGGPVIETSRPAALKHYPEKVLSSEHNNSLN
jgi:hypothetical protein